MVVDNLEDKYADLIKPSSNKLYAVVNSKPTTNQPIRVSGLTRSNLIYDTNLIIDDEEL